VAVAVASSTVSRAAARRFPETPAFQHQNEGIPHERHTKIKSKVEAGVDIITPNHNETMVREGRRASAMPARRAPGPTVARCASPRES